MWCCVGTGMENHSKYGHFAYTHDGDSVLYVNLFVPSTLSDTRFGLTQTTSYPYGLTVYDHGRQGRGVYPCCPSSLVDYRCLSNHGQR